MTIRELYCGVFFLACSVAGCHRANGDSAERSSERSSNNGSKADTARSSVEAPKEDYAVARSHFQTHLIQHTPSPQPGDPLVAPSGAEQVEYSPTLHLKAWVTADTKSLSAAKPAVLFLHGGFAMGADDWEMAAPYRDAGYIVMMPAVRGENGQDGDFSMFYDEVSDTQAAADYLAKMPNVDAKHLYVAGHSAGGTLTLLLALSSTNFQAAASFSGVSDIRSMTKRQSKIIPFDVNDAREIHMRSAVDYAPSFKCPTRLYSGDQEKASAAADQETSKRAKQKGLDVDVETVPGDHFTAVPEEIRRSIKFFQAH